MAPYAAPPQRPRKPPPSWWWFLGPAILTVAAIAVGVGGFLSTLHEVGGTYDEFRPDGEPHAVSVPTADRAMLMVPEGVDRLEWRCRVTDDEGRALSTRESGGSFSFSNDRGSWESLLTFDPADAATGTDEVPASVTVVVECSRLGDGPGDTVRVTKAPQVAAIVGRVALTVLGPLALGGAAFAWMIVLVVLQVVRRTGA